MIRVLKIIILSDEIGEEILVTPGEYEYSPETWEICVRGRWFDIVVDELANDGFIKEV